MVAPELVAEAAVVFEPQFNPSQLGITVLAIAAPFGYWWYITVPEARLDLAKDKRRQDGEVKQYIDELQRDPAPRPVERWFFSKWIGQARPPPPVETTMTATATAPSEADTPSDGDAPASAAAPPTPTPPARRAPTVGELFRPASLKGNATPRFWSGDNPIVVTTGTLIALGVASALVRNGGSGGQLLLDATVVGAGLAFGLGRLRLK